MRVIVTGGAGFLGSAIVSKVSRAGHSVLVLDSFNFSYDPSHLGKPNFDITHRFSKLLCNAKIERCDLLDRHFLAQKVADFQPNTVIHLAALPLVSVATQNVDEARRSLNDGLINLLEAVRKVPSIERFVYVSSSMIYGNFASDPVSECAEKEPVNLYGGLKLSGEVLSKSYLQLTKTKCTVVRPSAVFGPGEAYPRVVKKFCENALQGRPLVINDGSDSLIDFTFIDDFTDGLFLAAFDPNGANDEFNISYGEAASLFDLADEIKKLVPTVRIETSATPDLSRPRRGSLSIEKAKQVLGYCPNWPLKKAIPAYLKYLSPRFSGASLSDW